MNTNKCIKLLIAAAVLMAVCGTASVGCATATDNAKEWDGKTKTITIKDNKSVDIMTVRLISSEPDLCTFTEVFEVTNLEAFTPEAQTDFKARTVKHTGKGDVQAVEWFIEQNVSYTANITDYKVVQVKKDVYNNKTGKNETILVNETIISGYHDETRYKNEWQDYKPHGKPVSKDSVQRIKVVYRKPPEVGEVSIQTIPMFRGVECDELTWWNTSFAKRKPVTLTGNTSGAQTDYQIELDVTYDSDMQADFDDLRFANDAHQIDAWLQTKTDSTSATVWVEFPTTPASGVDQTYYMYYGHATAANDWDGAATFAAFFDGDSTGWTEVDPNSRIAFANDRLEFTGLTRNENAYVHKTITGFTDGFLVDYSWKVTAFDSSANAILFAVGDMVDDGASIDNSIRNSFQGTSYNYMGTRIADSNTWAEVHGATSLNTQYWNEIYVVLGTAYFKIYTDSAKTTQLGSTKSTTTTGLVISDLDVAYAIQSWNSGNSYSATGWIDDYRLRNYVANPATYVFGAEEDQPSLCIESYAPATPFTKNEGDSQTFNVTASESCQCRWYIDGVLVETDSTPATDHAYTNSSLALGNNQNFSAVVNTSAASDMQTWDVNVSAPVPTYHIQLTSTAHDTTGNSIATTETCTDASFATGTLAGGTEGGDNYWADTQTGASMWGDMGDMASIAVIVVMMGLLIGALKGGADIKVVVGAGVGLLMLAAIFSIAPGVGNDMEAVVDLDQGQCATGRLTFVCGGSVTDGETVTIDATTLEYDLAGDGVTAGRVDVDIPDGTAATASLNLAAAINNNATLATIVTASRVVT